MKQPKLTISQLATHAGVTTRAVRHYHAIGLLPEPPRDDSGYRRYDAQDVIELIRIKTLTNAGIPLAQIRTVLQATDVDFDKTISAIEADITRHIAELEQTKKQLKKLHAGEALYLQPAVTQYLEHLRQLGISEELVVLERDAWVLLSALAPDKVTDWVKRKNAMLQDKSYAQLYQQYDQARHWDVSDPRLEKLAQQTITATATYSEQFPANAPETAFDSPQAQSLISTYNASPFPAWQRLEEIIKSKHHSALS